MDTSAMVEFKINAEGTLEMDGGTVLEFDDRLPTHRALDVVREMEGDIRAKVEGRFTDGDRYRAFRALSILISMDSPIVKELQDSLKQAGDGPATESEIDSMFDSLVQALNDKVAEVTAKQDAELLAQAAAARAEGFVGDDEGQRKDFAADLAHLHNSALEAAAKLTGDSVDPKSLIYIPEPRKLRVPETTLIDPTDA